MRYYSGAAYFCHKMRKIIFLSVSLCASILLKAQFQFLPPDITSAMAFDMGRLGKKMDLKKISGFQMLKSSDSLEGGYMAELMRRIAANLEDAGVDVKQKVVFYTRNDSMNTSAYLIPLSSDKKMLKALENFNKDILFETDKLHVGKDKNATWYINAKNRLGVAVYGNLCYIMKGPWSYYWSNDEWAYDRALDSMRARIDSIRGNSLEPAPAPAPIENIDNGDQELPPSIDTTRYVPEDGDYVEAPSPADYGDSRYDDDSLMIAFRAWWQKKREKEELKWWQGKEQAYKNYMNGNYALAKSKKGAFYTDANFKEQANVASDLFQWVDFTPYLDEIIKTAQCYRYYDEKHEYQSECDTTVKPRETTFGKFLGSLYLSGHGDFNNGNTNMNYEIKMSDSVQKYFDKMLGKTVNKALFDFIKVPQVASLSAQNLYTPAAADLYFAAADQWRITFNASKKDKQLTNRWNYAGMAAFEIFYAFIDKDMLYNTFPGGSVSAVTGMITSHESYNSWEYDDEGNYVPTVKYYDAQYPKFISILELGKNQNLDKILNPLVKNEVLELNGNIYSFRNENGARVPFFMVKTNGYLLITNDSLYRNPEYLKMPPGLDQSLVDNISSKPFYLEMNGQGTKNLVTGLTQISNTMRNKSNNALEALNKVTVTTNGSLNKFNINVDFTNKTRCSFIDMMEMIDLLYQQ